MSGIWAADQMATFNLIRIGNIVTIQLNVLVSATANAASIIQSVDNLAVKWRPLVNVRGTFSVLDNGVDVMGAITIDSAGAISIFADIDQASFAGAGASGIRGSSFTYIIL